MKCLLAPVPVIHLSSAMEVYKQSSRVAFTTDMLNFFDGDVPKVDADMVVYLLATQTGLVAGSKPALKIGHVQLRGKFARYIRTNTGFHPDPACRPLSTATDTAVLGFFEVEELEIISAIPLSKFIGSSGKSLSPPLRRPVIAKLSEISPL